uniref:amidase n=1 Tax=Orrella sp. TaxID=1921583 RepID=UPI00404843DA
MKTDLTLAQWSQARHTSQVKSTELTAIMLERIETAGDAVFTRVFREQSLSAALAADKRWSEGAPLSPIDGVPIAVKDLFDLEGFTTRAGSVVLADEPVADSDAIVVQRLRQVGAVILGSTNMTEFAYSGLGINPHYGTPLSPWDRATARVAGGSSSGSGVAVSDGMAIAAVGTDTGGSVRIPSAFCGLTGFKPTAHRVSQQGALPLSTSLDSIGPLARTVNCCYWLDAVMAGTPERLSAPLGSTVLRGRVFAQPKQLVLEGMDDTVARTYEAACHALSKAGASIVSIDLPELDLLASMNAAGGFTAVESWALHHEWLAKAGERYDPRVASRIRRGQHISEADYQSLVLKRRDWISRVNQKISGVDALIMPTVPVVPPGLAPLMASDETYAQTNLLVLRNPSVINFLDGCSISLPCHQPGEAPVGLMLSAISSEDERLLSLAQACEAALASQ